MCLWVVWLWIEVVNLNTPSYPQVLLQLVIYFKCFIQNTMRQQIQQVFAVEKIEDILFIGSLLV
jgi:hypothetical protein